MSEGWLGLVLIFRLDLLQQTDQLVQGRPETRLLKARKCLRQVETLSAPMDQPVGPGKTGGQAIGEKATAARARVDHLPELCLLEIHQYSISEDGVPLIP
jgi:hypothetical protein